MSFPKKQVIRVLTNMSPSFCFKPVFIDYFVEYGGYKIAYIPVGFRKKISRNGFMFLEIRIGLQAVK